MSWNKNTICISNIDGIVEVLEEAGATYKMTTLGRVAGWGLNDTFENRKDYPIRKLEYGDKVILERMLRSHDCDVDDVITSFKFDKKDAPQNWEIEVFVDGEEFENGWGVG